jgi:hypothetical protein
MKASHIALLGVGAAYMIARAAEADSREFEFDEDDYDDNVIAFPKEFDPAAYELDLSEYSGAKGQARRRNRKSRKYEKAVAKYRECVGKKSRSHRKCRRLKRKAQRIKAKAEKLQSKLEASGSQEALDWSPLGPAAVAAAKAASPQAAAFIESAEAAFSDDGFDDFDDAAMEPPPSNLPILIGGVAVVGLGGVLLFMATRKPKKK